MAFIDDIKELKPRRFNKPNHFKIFSFIGKVFDVVFEDTKQTIRNFFPYLSSSAYLLKHANSLGLYQFDIENEEDLRDRLMTVYDYLSKIGEKSVLLKYLELFFPDRFEINDSSVRSFRIGYVKIGYFKIGIERTLTVKIDDLTVDEKNKLNQFLEAFLDPDISFAIIEREEI
ncbi:MAG: hypothetical protein JXB50_12325 [Spirochaetes bacterium]|nr:hypothetical protein [Spirochaetota bacterium]